VLRRARRARRAGDWRTVVDLLRDDSLPTTHARSVEWDTLLVRGALRAGMAAGERGDPALLALARARATRAIAHGPAGSRALVSMRYARATACLNAPLGCSSAQVRDDLTWTLAFGQGTDRAEARRVLLGSRLAAVDARRETR
jgi:hypothetical protein